MKVLVSGGAGFIGSNIVDELLDRDYQVVVIDNLSTGKKNNLNRKAKFYKADITDAKAVEKIFKKEKCDFVNHHAAQIDVRISVNNPALDAKINLLGLLHLLQCSVKYKVKKFINVSSGGVIYGEEARLPTKEDAPKSPISPYGVSKLAAEYYVEFFSRIYGLEYTTLRYSNVYGPRQDPKGEAGVVAIFSNRMIHNKECTIYGDGNQTRDYVYVKDVVSANLAALKKGKNQAFNIGTQRETSVNELFNVMKKVTDYNGTVMYGEARAGELLKSCLDISKAKKMLGWMPIYTLEDGLKETAGWVRKQK